MFERLFLNGFLAYGLGLVLPLMAIAQSSSLVATKINGTRLSGELVAWNASELTLQTENDFVSIPSSQLLRLQWEHPKSNDKTPEIFLGLVDGTRLPLQSYEVLDGVSSISTTLAEQSLTLATDRIAFVQLATDAPAREQLYRDLDGDLLVIRKKKAGTFDNLSGILGNVSAKQVAFTWEGEAIPVKRSKVVALAYFHARKPIAQEFVCWLNLNDGGRLPVVKITLHKQNVRVQTSGNLEFSVPLKSLHDADYSQGKLVYLSDLRPIDQRWTPRIGLPASAALIQQHGLPRRDQSYSGSVLSLRWPSAKTASVNTELKTYGKGLALRSRTEIRYLLPKGMRRFVTLAGIDPETAHQGHVTLEIFADRRSVWQGEIDGTLAPTEINVALDNARELRIVVDYGNNLDFGDRVHLAEARLSK